MRDELSVCVFGWVHAEACAQQSQVPTLLPSHWSDVAYGSMIVQEEGGD